jgi:hypothetical protein
MRSVMHEGNMTIIQKISSDFYQQIPALVSGIIALLALIISLWQLSVQRRHNKLSVTPLITFDKIYTPTANGFGIYIRNAGIGPAVIIDFIIYIDNNKLTAKHKELWVEAAKILGINYKLILMQISEPGTGIAAGSRLPILTIEKRVNERQENEFALAIDRLNIEIIYESIYKTRYNSKLNENA